MKVQTPASNNYLVAFVTAFTEGHPAFSLKRIFEVASELEYRPVLLCTNETYPTCLQHNAISIPINKLGLSAKPENLAKTLDMELYKIAIGPYFPHEIDNLLIFDSCVWPMVSFLRPCTKNIITCVRNLSKPIVEMLQLRGFPYQDEATRQSLETLAFNSADILIANSKSTKSLLESKYDMMAKVALCQVNIDPTVYRNYSRIQKFPNKKCYYVGRLDLQKGVQYLYDSPTYRLEIYGESLMNRGLMKVPEGPNTFYMGFSAEYYKEVADSSIALFPSLYEANGLAIQEALTMGKLCFVQRGSWGLEEYVSHNINGFVIDFATERWDEQVSQILGSSSAEKLSTISSNAMKTIPKDSYNNYPSALKDTLERLSINESR